MKEIVLDLVKSSIVGGVTLFLVLFTYLHVLEAFGI